MIGNRKCAFALSTAFAIIYAASPAIAAQFEETGTWPTRALGIRRRHDLHVNLIVPNCTRETAVTVCTETGRRTR